MTRKRVTDEEFGRLTRRTGELVRRVDEGTRPFQEVMDGLQALIEGRFGVNPSFVTSVHNVVVDYSKPLAEMIQAGHYAWTDNAVTQDHFPIQGKGQEEVEVALFHFNRVITSGDAIALMAKEGYRPAKIEELLALGAIHPELQKKFPIVALGSQWRDSRDDRCVPYLDWDSGERRLRLDWFGDHWSGHCRFLAVRK